MHTYKRTVTQTYTDTALTNAIENTCILQKFVVVWQTNLLYYVLFPKLNLLKKPSYSLKN